MKNLFKKMKSNKGATGTDVVVALSVILISIAVVSMIYVNMTSGSKRINRTSGATRIATNIMENIERLDYTLFEYQIGQYAHLVNTDFGDVSKDSIKQKVQNDLKTIIKDSGGAIVFTNDSSNSNYNETLVTDQLFGTRIPSGYKYTLVFSTFPEYGYDLMCSIDLTISFDVDERQESVNLNTVKKREMITECNSPVLTENMKRNDAFPIRYNSITKAYEATSEENPEWYNYSNKKWAMVYDAGANQSLSGQQLTAAKEANNNIRFQSSIEFDNTKIFVWIPRYGKVSWPEDPNDAESNKVEEIVFAYGMTDYYIEQIDIPNLASGDTTMTTVNSPLTMLSEKLDGTTSFGVNNKGLWQSYKGLQERERTTDVGKLACSLLDTKYGFNP